MLNKKIVDIYKATGTIIGAYKKTINYGVIFK